MKVIKTASGKKIKLSKNEWQAIGKKAGWIKEADGGMQEVREIQEESRKMIQDQGMAGYTWKTKVLIGFQYNNDNKWRDFKEVPPKEAQETLAKLNAENTREGKWSILGQGDTYKLDDLRMKYERAPRVTPSYGKAKWESRREYMDRLRDEF